MKGNLTWSIIAKTNDFGQSACHTMYDSITPGYVSKKETNNHPGMLAFSVNQQIPLQVCQDFFQGGFHVIVPARQRHFPHTRRAPMKTKVPAQKMKIPRSRNVKGF
jgi:hypothetical protein